MSWPTTRRYPRSMADAFPDVRACAIERPPRRLDIGQAAAVMLAVALGLLGAALLIHFLTPCEAGALCMSAVLKPSPGEDFGQPQPAEAATDLGTDVVMLYDGEQRRLGFIITAFCALVSLCVAGLGWWLKG